MLKAIGLMQLVVAPIFVLPAMTGQSAGGDLDAQLEATLQSIEYLGNLRSGVQIGDASAMRAIERATEAPRTHSVQRDAHLENLHDDIARLRYSLDRLLADPSEVAAITNMPPSVIRVLGLAGSSAVPSNPEAPVGEGQATELAVDGSASNGDPVLRGPITTSTDPAGRRPPVIAGTSPITGTSGSRGTAGTIGLDAVARSAINGDIAPLDEVRPTSRRRGNEAVPLEKEGYVADHARLGRLLVRADRTAEAIELLERATKSAEANYWLARAYEDAGRLAEALDIYRELSADESAGLYSRHARHDLEFLEFKSSLKTSR